MKNVLRISIALLTILFLFAGAANAVLIDLLGDEDGFGVGVPIGDGYHYLDYGEYWADNRDAGDPLFTDYWYTDDKSWTHTYSLPSTPITSANLEIYVAGIADWMRCLFPAQCAETSGDLGQPLGHHGRAPEFPGRDA